MFKNYLIVAFRNFVKHKSYAFINTAGLALGMASCLAILLFVRFELSYDQFHTTSSRTYRVVRDTQQAGKTRRVATTPIPLATALKRELPEVEEAVRFLPQQALVRYDQKAFADQRIFYADSSFFDIFDFALLRGNPQTALTRPFSLVMTQSKARALFGAENPIGKTLHR